MNDEQIKTYLGALTGVVLLALLAYGHVIGRPLPDRTLVIFALLLWAYLHVDISAGLPFLSLPSSEPARGEQEVEDDAETNTNSSARKGG